MTWHVEPDLAAAYATDRLDAARAASLEAHVTVCSHCREVVGATVDVDELEQLWVEVVDRVDAAHSSLTVRMLRGLGVRDATARLLAATPRMSRPWTAAIALVMAAAWVLHGVVSLRSNTLLFLYVAPLLPLAGVAAAYGPGLDEAHDLSLATPYPAYRLVLLRTACTASVVMAAGLAAALALPGPWLDAVRWLLPAAALSAGAFALLGRLGPIQVALVLGGSWAVAVTSVVRWTGDRAAPFGSSAQVVYALLAAAAVVAAATGRERFDVMRRSA